MIYFAIYANIDKHRTQSDWIISICLWKQEVGDSNFGEDLLRFIIKILDKRLAIGIMLSKKRYINNRMI
jgi:hypothetical protein